MECRTYINGLMIIAAFLGASLNSARAQEINAPNTSTSVLSSRHSLFQGFFLAEPAHIDFSQTLATSGDTQPFGLSTFEMKNFAVGFNTRLSNSLIGSITLHHDAMDTGASDGGIYSLIESQYSALSPEVSLQLGCSGLGGLDNLLVTRGLLCPKLGLEARSMPALLFENNTTLKLNRIQDMFLEVGVDYKILGSSGTNLSLGFTYDHGLGLGHIHGMSWKHSQNYRGDLSVAYNARSDSSLYLLFGGWISKRTSEFRIGNEDWTQNASIFGLNVGASYAFDFSTSGRTKRRTQ